MSDARPLYTIGHSTRPFEGFLMLLQREGIEHLVDVRRFPASRRHPHFDGAALAAALRDAGIDYEHAPSLGGRRAARRDSRNLGWSNASFRGYADHTATEEFQDALARVLDVARDRPTTVMCAEAVPWRCHRTLIADAAIARGWMVMHILDAKTQPHVLTSFGVIRHGRVEYPTPQGDDLFSAVATN
jgi:uncharacterized protein (DUF488 family)